MMTTIAEFAGLMRRIGTLSRNIRMVIWRSASAVSVECGCLYAA
jgi:hypothetical protein